MTGLLHELQRAADASIKKVLGIEKTCDWCDVKLKELTRDTEHFFVEFLARGTQEYTADPGVQGMRYGLADEHRGFVPPTASLTDDHLSPVQQAPAERPGGFAPSTATDAEGNVPQQAPIIATAQEIAVPSSGPTFAKPVEQQAFGIPSAGATGTAAAEFPVQAPQSSTPSAQPPGNMRKGNRRVGLSSESGGAILTNGAASASVHSAGQANPDGEANGRHQAGQGAAFTGSTGFDGQQGIRRDRGAEASTSGRGSEETAEAFKPAAAERISRNSVPHTVPIARPQQVHTSVFEQIQAKAAAFHAKTGSATAASPFLGGSRAAPAQRGQRSYPEISEGWAKAQVPKPEPQLQPQTEYIYRDVVSLSDASSLASESGATDVDGRTTPVSPEAEPERPPSSDEESAWANNGSASSYMGNGIHNSAGVAVKSYGSLPKPARGSIASGTGNLDAEAAAGTSRNPGKGFTHRHPIELSSDSEDDIPLSQRKCKSMSPEDVQIAERFKQAQQPGHAKLSGEMDGEAAPKPESCPADSDRSPSASQQAHGPADFYPKASSTAKAAQAASASKPGSNAARATAAASAERMGTQRRPASQTQSGISKPGAANGNHASPGAKAGRPARVAPVRNVTSRSTAAALKKLQNVNPRLAEYLKSKHEGAAVAPLGDVARPAWPEANLPATQARKGQAAAAGKPGTGNRKAGATKPDWKAAATWFHTQGPNVGAAASNPQTRNGTTQQAAGLSRSAPRTVKTPAHKQASPATPAGAKQAKQPVATTKAKIDAAAEAAEPQSAKASVPGEAAAAAKMPDAKLPKSKGPAEAAGSPHTRSVPKFRPLVPPRKRANPVHDSEEATPMRRADGERQTSLDGPMGTGNVTDSPPARSELEQEGGPSPFVIVLDETPTPEKDDGQASREEVPMPGQPEEDGARESPAPMDIDPAVQNGDQPLTAGSQPGEDCEGDEGNQEFQYAADMHREELREERADADKVEWEARRKEIERQAEEARRLKKRRRMEAEIDQRTQARLEDHRRQLALQDQAINEREQLRSTIRAELQTRTRGFKTLAGILLALGIEVEGRHMATTQQLTKAHRKAMLRFHPDRFASASLAEQVRAEELFKIISHAPKPGAR